MKKLIFLCGLITHSLLSIAQNDTIYVWNKWCAHKDSMLLFNEGNNTIQVYSHAFKPADIKLKSLDGSLRIGNPEIKGDTTSVLAMPYPDKGKIMRLAIVNKKTNRIIKTVSFSSADIPELIARLGNIEGNEANRKDMLLQTTMKTTFPNSLYSYPYKIRQFTFAIHTPKGSANINANGFFLTNDMFQQIKDAPAGTMVEFTNIKATCPDCATRALPDLKIRIRQ